MLGPMVRPLSITVALTISLAAPPSNATPAAHDSPAIPSAGEAACVKITRVPFTIAASGTYCLAEDLTLHPDPSFGMRLNAPAAIKVLADDVTIDFAGHTLDDVTNGIATNALAIRAKDRKHLAIRNGTISRYFIGVAAIGDESEDVTVEHMRFEKVRYSATSLNQVKGFVVRENDLVGMGHGNAWYMPHAILVSGTGVVASNVIQDVIPNSHRPPRIDTEAISVKAGQVTIEGNLISNASIPEGESYGIRVSPGATATITRNTIVNFKYPVISPGAGGAAWINTDNEIR